MEFNNSLQLEITNPSHQTLFYKCKEQLLLIYGRGKIDCWNNRLRLKELVSKYKS